MFMELQKCHHNLILEHFRHPKKKPLLTDSHSLVPTTLSPVQPQIYFMSIDLPTMDISYK